MMRTVLENMPIVAILRGVQPGQVGQIGEVLYEGGVRCIEVPMNSPSPLNSIEVLARTLPDDCLVGAGTVLSALEVARIKSAGGVLVVAPNTVPAVIRAALESGMEVAPGVATPTEAFVATDAGARYLKLFPASTYGPAYLQAVSAVLPADVHFLAVGGIGPEDFDSWRAAGAIGFGIGTQLYRAGDTPAAVKQKLSAIRAVL